MTSISFHYRSHARNRGHWGSLYVRVIHHRQSGTYTLPYKLHVDEWNQRLQSVRYNHTTDPSRQYYLREVNRGIMYVREQLEVIIQKLSFRTSFTVNDILKGYKTSREGLVGMMNIFTTELENEGRFRTARAYRTALRRLLGFCGKPDLSGSELTEELITGFESFLKKENRSANTISFYMRNLRAIYNKGVDRCFISFSGSHPFRQVFTGVAHTPKRALKREEIKSFERMLKEQEKLTVKQLDALHLFLFSFHAQGMSFVDLAYLKKKDLIADELTYFRKKTKQRVHLVLTVEARRHIRYFATRQKNSEYLFPVITNTEKSTYLQYCNGLNMQNRRLKEVQKKAKLKTPLTMHQARHSWATTARNESVPEELISAALGHSSVKTTRIYLDGFGRPLLKMAAGKVSRSVRV